MSDGKGGSIRDMIGNYAALARRASRYWRRAFLLAVLITVAGMVWVIKRPRMFKSEASAAIHETTASGADPRSTEEANAELRARLDQVYGSRANLGRIIDEIGLYPWLRGRTSRLKIIEAFQGALDYSAAGRDTFRLGFVYNDPVLAQRTIRRLLQLYTDERRAAGQAQARQDLGSVDTAIASLESVLSEQEERLERFERANHDMVEQVRARRLGQAAIARARHAGLTEPVSAPLASDPDDSPRMRRLRVRLHALQNRLAALQRPEIVRAPAAPEPAVLSEESERIQTLRRNVAEIRDRLTRLRTTYTEAYPDVQIQARRLAEAERELQSALAQERARRRGTTSSGVTVDDSAARASQIASLQRAIESTREDLAVAAREQREARARGENPDSRQAAAPGTARGLAPNPGFEPAPSGSEWDRPLASLVEVEAAWDRLLAELGTTRTRYQQLLARKFELQAQLDTVNTTGADVLRVIDPPSLPTEPEPPGRTRLAMVVMAVAFLLGLGTATLSALLDGTVYEPSDLRRWGELPELPAIPDLSRSEGRHGHLQTATGRTKTRG